MINLEFKDFVFRIKKNGCTEMGTEIMKEMLCQCVKWLVCVIEGVLVVGRLNIYFQAKIEFLSFRCI